MFPGGVVSDSPAGTSGRRTGRMQEQLCGRPPGPSAPSLAPPSCSTQEVMSEKGHSTLTEVRVVKQVGLLPEGGGVVQEEAEQLGTVTFRV